MTVFYNKARARWQYDFVHKGQRHQGYCIDAKTNTAAKNKTEAKNIEDIIRGQLKAGNMIEAAPPPPAGFSLAEPMAYYLKKMQGKPDFANVQTYAREILDFFGAATDMGDIDERKIIDYTNWQKIQRKRIYAGIKDGKKIYKTGAELRGPKTINAYLQCIARAYVAFRNAPENKRLRESIPEAPEIVYLDVMKRIPRPIPQSVSKTIVDFISDENLHLKQAFILCLHTGMRERECAKIRTRQYNDTERCIALESEQTKARKGRFLPVNDIARDVILQCIKTGDLLWEELQKSPEDAARYAAEYNIHRRDDIPLILWRHYGVGLPRPVRNIATTAWKKLKKKHGIDYRWHDARAAFCTNTLRGADINTVQRLAGHESILTTQRYLEAADQQKIAAVQQLAANYPVGMTADSLTEVPNKVRRKKGKTV